MTCAARMANTLISLFSATASPTMTKSQSLSTAEVAVRVPYWHWQAEEKRRYQALRGQIDSSDPQAFMLAINEMVGRNGKARRR